jgi:hypothetical protein
VANITVLYGTSNPATNLTLTQLQNGVLVTVPDSATSLIVYNQNANVIADCPTNIVTYPISSTPDPTSTPNPTSAPTSTPSATNQPTPNPTSNPTATPAPTDGSTPIPTSTANPTNTPAPTSTPNPTPTPTVTGTIYYYNADCRSGCLSETASVGLQAAPNAIVVESSSLIPLNSYVGLTNNQGCWEIISVATAPSVDTVNAFCADPTATPNATAAPTPTPTATGTASQCLMYNISNYSMFESLSYNYTDCTTGQVVSDIMQPDYDYYVCSLTRPVRTGGSNSYEISAGSVDPICEPAASATPAPSSTPNPTPETLLNFYITGPQFILDNFCTTNYTATTLVRIASTNGLISGTLNKTAYQSNGTTPYQGSAGRYYFISDTSGAGSTTTQDPRYYVEIGPDGWVNNVGTLDCSGGGGGGGNQL